MSTQRLGRVGLLVLGLALGAALLPASEDTQERQVRAAFEQEVRPFLDTFCIKCHGIDKKKGDVSFAPYQRGRDPLDARPLWRTLLAELTARDMPPEQEKQPDDAQRQRVMAWARSLRRLETPDPGEAAIRRLSRMEYENTLRDLFGADVHAGVDLPDDNAGEAFDNSLSPLLMEKYLLAADEVLDRLIMPEQFQRHLLAGQMDALIAGAPDAGKADGTDRRFAVPGEVMAVFDLPVEGSYTIRIRTGAEQAGAEPVRLGVRFDNQVVSELKITARPKSPATTTCTVKLLPGRTRFSIVFMNPLLPETPAAPAAPTPAAPAKPGPGPKPKPAPPERKPEPAKDKTPAAPVAPAAPPAVRAVVIESIDLVGPLAKPPTEVQRRLFSATPSQEPGKELGRQAAAQRILEPFAYRAFRRPPYREEIQGLLKVFALADAQDQGWVDSVKLMLKAVLVSPQFLYRTPEDLPAADGATAGKTNRGASDVVAVGDHELATRLSYFLWATMPDDELLRLAREGRLHEPAQLEAQVRRLMQDPRSRALSETFIASWLGLNQFASTVVDEKKFPQLTREVRAGMYDEVMTFSDNLMRAGGSVLDLIDCDYAFVNTHTAKLYGLDAIKGAKMQRVTLSDHNRGGLVGMPAILMVTSRSDRTSPVKRGKWVLETLFNAAPPPPPANVDALDKQDTPANADLTLRQKTERHRTDPACASCHRIMDPLGFGLENFDAIGRWRAKDDSGGPVDAQGELPGKQRFSSPSELKQILMARKDEFARAFAAKLLGFALGRRLGGYDEVVVDDLAAGMPRDHYQLDTLIVRIVSSYPFLHRRAIR